MFALYEGMRNVLMPNVQRGYILALALVVAPGLAAAQKRAASPADTTQMIAVQVALDRAGFSPGEIDGRGGPKTRLAVAEFQKSVKVQPTGAVSEETLTALQPPAEPVLTYTITPQDVAGPFIDAMPRDMMESAKLPALAYTSALEALSEKFHSSPALLRTLNPGATWAAGEAIKVPNVEPFELPVKEEKPAAAAKSAATAKPAANAKPAATAKPAAANLEVLISGANKSLAVRDAAGKVLMYAPITVGSSKDPLPIGDWKVVGVSWNPTFNYNPDLFWDADPAHAKAKIPPGPNNPVGVVWVDINKEHFGLHGTPEPSTIGRTESHGCIRLTNWDATKLGRLVSAGTKVTIQQ
jgi:lipoprotein-anchoring transpeptidase ErfK/SrfK